MKIFLILLVGLGFLACKDTSTHSGDTNLWQYNSKQHNPQMDQSIQPILLGYQALLRGYTNKDTNYLQITGLQLIQISDSLAGLKLSNDTAMQHTWITGLGNISAELNGLIEANKVQDTKELAYALNMTAVQILQLLSQMGYQANYIYVFNAPNEYIEDGVYWLGLQKLSKNPFNYEQKTIAAVGVLQEMK